MSIEQISTWFRKAIPNPGPRNVNTQFGVHFEEVAEMLGTLMGTDDESTRRLREAEALLTEFATDLKKGKVGVVVSDRVELLDSLCDQVVTAVGVGQLHGMDVVAAVKEVADSNDSKFDDDGNPILDENFKVVKGPKYFRPDLLKFSGQNNGPEI